MTARISSGCGEANRISRPPWPVRPKRMATVQSLRDPNRMTNFGTSFDVEMGVARKDRTHGQTLTTR